ncbi:expansin C-terminal domain-related protein, partial [Actinoplanes sp. NPDC005259]
FVEGTSQYYWAVTIDNHSNPIRSVQAKGPGGGWKKAALQDYNVWIIDGQTGSGPFQVRMTDIYGKTITAKNIKLQPQKRQTTSVRFATGSSTEAAPAAPAKKKPSPSPSKASPSPSTSASSAAPLLESTTQAAAPAQDEVALAAAEPMASCG